MARVIAIANQKGGVGKTTTTINIGVSLAQRGRSVTLIDFDPQASLTHGLGSNPETLERTIYDVLLNPNVPFYQVLLHPKPNLSLAPANIDLAGAEFELTVNADWQYTLKRRLTPFTQGDFLLIDCPTSLGALTINALVAAQEVLIPAECSYLVFRGLTGLFTTITAIQNRFNPDLKVTTILPVKVGPTLHAREALEEMRRIYGALVSEITIPQRVKVADALIAGQSVLEFAPHSDAAEAYRRLTEEVIDHA